MKINYSALHPPINETEREILSSLIKKGLDPEEIQFRSVFPAKEKRYVRYGNWKKIENIKGLPLNEEIFEDDYNYILFSYEIS